MPLRIPKPSSATHARQSVPAQEDIDAIVAGISGEGVLTGCTPSAGAAGLAVNIAAGTIRIGGNKVTVNSGTVSLAAADATNPRIDLVYVDATGTLGQVTGVAANPAQRPNLGSSRIYLAEVYVPAGATATANFGTGDPSKAEVLDKRVLLPNTSASEHIHLLPGTGYGSMAPTGTLTNIAQADVPYAGTDTRQYAWWIPLPNQLDINASIPVTLYWRPHASSSGGVVWEAGIAGFAQNEVTVGVEPTATATQTVNVAAGDEQKILQTTFTFNAAQHQLAATDIILAVRIRRLGDDPADTATATALLQAVGIVLQRL